MFRLDPTKVAWFLVFVQNQYYEAQSFHVHTPHISFLL